MQTEDIHQPQGLGGLTVSLGNGLRVLGTAAHVLTTQVELS